MSRIYRTSWVLAVLVFSSAANAAIISYNGATVNDLGASPLNLLVLQGTGQETSESGSIHWNGSSDKRNERPGVGNQGKNTSKTQNVASLAAKGIDAEHFAIVLNISENDNVLFLNGFNILFQNNTGTVLFSASYAVSNQSLAQGGAGHVFHVTGFTPSELAFFNTSSNRVGMEVLATQAITSADNGAETFYVAPIAALPEPASCLGLMGLVGLALRRARR